MVAASFASRQPAPARVPSYESRPPAAVAAVIATYPPAIQQDVLALRWLILSLAEGIPAVGAIEETLKWGEPAFLTTETGSGSTVRIGWKPARPDEYALYFNCQTRLVDDFREMFGDTLRCEGNRAIVFRSGQALPVAELGNCIAMALTYHAAKRGRR